MAEVESLHSAKRQVTQEIQEVIAKFQAEFQIAIDLEQQRVLVRGERQMQQLVTENILSVNTWLSNENVSTAMEDILQDWSAKESVICEEMKRLQRLLHGEFEEELDQPSGNQDAITRRNSLDQDRSQSNEEVDENTNMLN